MSADWSTLQMAGEFDYIYHVKAVIRGALFQELPLFYCEQCSTLDLTLDPVLQLYRSRAVRQSIVAYLHVSVYVFAI